VPLKAKITTLRQWQEVWKVAKVDAWQGEVRFAGKDVHKRSPADLDRLLPADFRLAAGSTGKGSGPGGRDAGADMEQVGPGAAYDRWRGTADYRAWRRRSGLPVDEDDER
jgi:hypothetical protein